MLTDTLCLEATSRYCKQVTEAGQWEDLLKTLEAEGKEATRVSVKPLGEGRPWPFKLGGSQGACECGKVSFQPYRTD